MIKIDQGRMAASLSTGVSARHRANGGTSPSALDRWVRALVVAGVLGVSAFGGLGAKNANAAECRPTASQQALVDEKGRALFDDLYADVATARAGQVIEDKMGRIKYLTVQDRKDGTRYIEQEVFDRPSRTTEIHVGEFRKDKDGHWQPERWGFKMNGKVFFEDPDDDVETTKPYVYEKETVPSLDEIELIEARAEAKARKADPEGWKDVPDAVFPAHKPVAVQSWIPAHKPPPPGESAIVKEALKPASAKVSSVDSDLLSRWRQGGAPKAPGF